MIGDASHVYLVDPGIASVDSHGKLGHLNPNASLDAAAIYRDGLVGLNDAKPAVELLIWSRCVSSGRRKRLAFAGRFRWRGERVGFVDASVRLICAGRYRMTGCAIGSGAAV